MDLADGRIKVKNWFDFTNPKDLAQGTWEVKADGRTVASGTLPALDIAPREEKEFTLALPKIDAAAGRRVLAERQLHAEARHRVGAAGPRDRLGPVRAAGVTPAEGRSPPSTAALEVKDSDDDATIQRQGLLAAVRQEGRRDRRSIAYQGVDAAGARSAARLLARATNNDRGAWKVHAAPGGRANKAVNIELWREAGPRWDVKDVRVEKVDDSTAQVTVQRRPAGGRRHLRDDLHGPRRRRQCRWSAATSRARRSSR